jgi:hypothetical protein
MVIVRIQGGLGNQMFQYATALALSIDRGIQVMLDTSSYAFDRKRRFALGGFDGVADRMSSGQVGIFRPTQERMTVTVVDDDFRTFDFPTGNLYLNGYWQSERHFVRHADQVSRDFGMIRREDLLRTYPGIVDGVAVHVRRTDYLSSNGYHPVLPITYYQAALERLGPGLRPFVFSDDPGWCEANLRSGPFSDAVVVRSTSEFDDLFLMSRARHNVIANSSFSWWGAWLNRRDKRRVVAPSEWFGQAANIDTGNILPSDWEIVSVPASSNN